MFSVAAESYDRFMGRYSAPLAPQLADLADVRAGQRVLDVGCGPGALVGELARRVGPGRVTAVDPSEQFVAAAAARHPRVDVRVAAAEQLPFGDDAFDACLAQLVVHFMDDPHAGLREMRRVTRPGGVVAACVWDFADGGSPLSLFWHAARELDASAPGEAARPGARRGHLAELLAAAGLADVQERTLAVRVEHPTFEDWWQPFTLGVGPAGTHVAGLDAAGLVRLEQHCRELLRDAPFTVEGRAWAARGVVPPA